MDPRCPEWLQQVVPTARTASTKLSELRRIESVHGDLDAHVARDDLETVIGALTSSAIDARSNKPNPPKLLIEGDLRNNLASCKSAVNKYVPFRRDIEAAAAAPFPIAPAPFMDIFPEPVNGTHSLKRDPPAALRVSISQLEPGLTIIDGGAERIAPSGRIDILARDTIGQRVVIDLKTVKAPRDAVGQVLA